MRDTHPSADVPADVSEPAFLMADQHTHHQQAEQNSDRAYQTASHLIQNSLSAYWFATASRIGAPRGNLFAHFAV
jgi:hypothetical protein